jgi:hypothetical protein
MDQNNLIAFLIPVYQKFISGKQFVEGKADAKLRPKAEAETESLEAPEQLIEEPDDSPADVPETEEKADEKLEETPEENQEFELEFEVEPEPAEPPKLAG